MSWQSRGLVFDVRDWSGCPAVGAFAQSPQALVLEDRVRVYFSTRSVDGMHGRWRSDVAFVDFTLDFGEVLGDPQGDVIARGSLGAFDEHGIFPFSVLPVGEEVWAYTTGWSRRQSVPVETGIGLATSHDGGLTFKRLGIGPVLTSSPFEPFLVRDALVRRWRGAWFMWYLFGTLWERPAPATQPERTYKIGVARSSDGVVWTPSGGRPAIPDRLGAGESQALPSVLAGADELHMAFCYRESVDFRADPTRSYRLGYATSSDGINWRRDDAQIAFPRLEFDSDMRCYPNLVEADGRQFLLYNGNDFGRMGFGMAEWVT